jgi:hypothetical protein
MKQWVIVFCLCFISVFAYCQDKDKMMNRVLKRLTGKTWIMKLCNDGSGNCQFRDSNYYFFPLSFSTVEYAHQTKCVQLINYEYYKDPYTNKIKFGAQLCNPIICFCDSSSLKDTYNVYMNVGGNAFRKGTFTFMSDGEFYCYPLPIHAAFFKSINPPKEVLSAIPK